MKHHHQLSINYRSHPVDLPIKNHQFIFCLLAAAAAAAAAL